MLQHKITHMDGHNLQDLLPPTMALHPSRLVSQTIMPQHEFKVPQGQAMKEYLKKTIYKSRISEKFFD